MNTLKNASFQTKLIFTLLLISVFSISVTLFITYSSYKSSLEKNAKERMSSILASSKTKVSEYYVQTKSFSDLLSNDRLIEGLFIAYEGAFYGAGYSMGKDQLLAGPAFKRLDEVYKKNALQRVKAFQISNFLLVNITGQVVFSAQPQNEDIFLGRSLTGGEFKTSLLAQCIAKAKSSNSRTAIYSDFEYFAKANKTYAFYCMNAFSEFDHLSEGIKKGDLLGTVAVQINIDHINKLLSNSDDKTSEKTYIEGSHQNEQKMNGTINSGLVKETADIEIEGKKWSIVTENVISEIYAPLKELLKKVFFLTLLVLIIVFGIGFYLIKKLIAPIIESSETLSDVCNSLNKDSNQLSKNANTLDDSSKNQAKSLHSTVQAIQEIASTIEQNTANATNTEKLARSSLDLANKGRIVIEQMVQSMNDINNANHDILNQVNESNDKINEILNLIAEIENKTKIINDIVFQTKLLSFNASVEAARAGEQGKGFAVVSEEIGKLAQSSGASAQDISELLTESIAKVDSIIHETKTKMEQVSVIGKEKVKSGQEYSKKCAQMFDDIITSFNQVASLVIEISHASSEQNSGMIEINQAMVHLNAGTDKTNQIAAESSLAASQLEQRAKTLGEVVQNIRHVIHGA